MCLALPYRWWVKVLFREQLLRAHVLLPYKQRIPLEMDLNICYYISYLVIEIALQLAAVIK